VTASPAIFTSVARRARLASASWYAAAASVRAVGSVARLTAVSASTEKAVGGDQVLRGELRLVRIEVRGEEVAQGVDLLARTGDDLLDGVPFLCFDDHPTHRLHELAERRDLLLLERTIHLRKTSHAGGEPVGGGLELLLLRVVDEGLEEFAVRADRFRCLHADGHSFDRELPLQRLGRTTLWLGQRQAPLVHRDRVVTHLDELAPTHLAEGGGRLAEAPHGRPLRRGEAAAGRDHAQREKRRAGSRDEGDDATEAAKATLRTSCAHRHPLAGADSPH